MVRRFTNTSREGEVLSSGELHLRDSRNAKRALQHPSAVDPPPLAATVAGRFLGAVFSNSRAKVITRLPGADHSWRSEFRSWSLALIAAAIYNPALIVGLRPEGTVRLIVVDIDNKVGYSSPYWHPTGQSRQMRALEREALASGCSVVWLRSSASGGLHALILLPAAVKAWQAHWVAVELVCRAGMRLKPGQCEVFPSQMSYSVSSDPRTWPKSNGVRLPGQEGSALLLGAQLVTSTDAIYSHLLQALDYTEALPSWTELQEAAEARRLQAGRGRSNPAADVPQNGLTASSGPVLGRASITSSNSPLGRVLLTLRSALSRIWPPSFARPRTTPLASRSTPAPPPSTTSTASVGTGRNALPRAA